MKRTLIIIAIFLTSSASMSQGSVMKKYFERYSSNEGFTKVSVSSKMFSLFTEMEGNSEDEEEFLEAVSMLKGMKAVVGEKVSNDESKKLYNEAVNDIDDAGYDELMTVYDAEENVKISLKEKDGIIEELILVAGGHNKFALLSLFGEIDLKKISKLASSMSIQGMKHLKNIDHNPSKKESKDQ